MNTTGVPAYLNIANQVRNCVGQGVYKPGEKLPTEGQFAAQFDVNRHTVRRALGILKLEGLLRSDQGSGVFVTDTPIRYPIGKRVKYNETLRAQGKGVRFELVRTIELRSGAAIAKELNVKLGELVGLVERLGLIDEKPISLSTSYFPLSLFPDILEQFQQSYSQQNYSISTVFSECYGCEHHRWKTRVSARSVRPKDAKLLALPLNQPILLTESVNVDQHNRIIQYGVTRFRGDRMELEFENPLPFFPQSVSPL